MFMQRRTLGAAVTYLGKARWQAFLAKGIISLIDRAYLSLPATVINKKGENLHRWRLHCTPAYIGLIKSIHYYLKIGNFSYVPKIRQITYDIATDASQYMGGIATIGAKQLIQRSIKFEGSFFKNMGLSKDSDIALKELYAILVAVIIAPKNCNLRIWSDNQTNIFRLAKGYSNIRQSVTYL